MNRQRIVAIIRDIEGYFSDLGHINIDDLKDKTKFYSTSMIMLSIVNRAIDVAEEIVADKKLGFPNLFTDKHSYRGKHYSLRFYKSAYCFFVRIV